MRAEPDFRKSPPISPPTPVPAPAAGPIREVVAKLAELLWEKEGRPTGREVEFRLQALAELCGDASPWDLNRASNRHAST